MIGGIKGVGEGREEGRRRRNRKRVSWRRGGDRWGGGHRTIKGI
jgi:hypothetical protein